MCVTFLALHAQNIALTERGVLPSGSSDARYRMPTKGQRVWLPVKDEDFSVLATVLDTRGDGSVLLERLHAPKEIQSLEVEVSADEFAKLSLAYGDVNNPGDDLVLLEDISDEILHERECEIPRGLLHKMQHTMRPPSLNTRWFGIVEFVCARFELPCDRA